MEIQSLRLVKPFKKASVWNITQSFHGEHPGIDIVSKYGTPLVAPENCKVIGLWGDGPLVEHNEGLERGYGLKLKGVVSGYTHIYWHCNPVFPVSLDEYVTAGQIVAFMGNAGNVSFGGKYVPLDERNTPPYKGTHLHQEVWNKANRRVDPVPLIEWTIEPAYTTGEWITAWFKVLAKIGKLVSK
jgi:murein DD-endopeptidase MepM/ murein hydrolase activator NlpD